MSERDDLTERQPMTERGDMTDTNDTGDDLLRRLAAADPVDPATINAANHQPPNVLLENIMNESANPAADSATLIDVAGPAGRPQRRSGLAGRGMLVAAAAAVLVLLGGILVLSPENTGSALATVQSAAAATADADTGRIASTFSVEADGEQPVDSLSGTLDADYAGSDLAVTVDVVGLEGAGPLDELPVNQFRLVDDVLYVNLGGSWMSLPTDGLLGDLVADYVDPRAVLERVEELTETTEVGSADINGVSTTHYQSVVDLGDETLSQSGWAGHEGLPIEAEGEVTIDLFVDDDGLLRRLDVSGDVQEEGDGDAGTFEVTMDFLDIGGDITIEAPADAEQFNPFGEGFDMEDFDA